MQKLTIQQQIAERIRNELVCCNVYQRVQEHPVHKRGEAVKVLREIHAYHDICYWGEASARLAEEFKEEN